MSYKVKIELEFDTYKPNKKDVFKYIKELYVDNSLSYEVINNKKKLHNFRNYQNKLKKGVNN